MKRDDETDDFNLLDYVEITDQLDFNGNSIWLLIAMSEFSNDGEQKDLEPAEKIENDWGNPRWWNNLTVGILFIIIGVLLRLIW